MRSISQSHLFLEPTRQQYTSEQYQGYDNSLVTAAQTNQTMLYFNPDGSRIPLYDYAEEDEYFAINIELPGVPADEIDLLVDDYGLEISALPAEQEGAPLFYGRLALPEQVVPEKTEALAKNGVLELKIYKVEISQGTKVEIKT
ncbi:MAG: Hsp20 family protein [Bacteroidota bacterium]